MVKLMSSSAKLHEASKQIVYYVCVCVCLSFIQVLTCLTELEALELAGGVALGTCQSSHTKAITTSTQELTSFSGFAMLGGGATGILGTD